MKKLLTLLSLLFCLFFIGTTILQAQSTPGQNLGIIRNKMGSHGLLKRYDSFYSFIKKLSQTTSAGKEILLDEQCGKPVRWAGIVRDSGYSTSLAEDTLKEIKHYYLIIDLGLDMFDAVDIAIEASNEGQKDIDTNTFTGTCVYVFVEKNEVLSYSKGDIYELQKPVVKYRLSENYKNPIILYTQLS